MTSKIIENQKHTKTAPLLFYPNTLIMRKKISHISNCINKMIHRKLLIALVFNLIILTALGYGMDDGSMEGSKSDFILWQLPPHTDRQNMSYVIQTAKGKVIVIDGGTKGDAPHLKKFLDNLGSRVHYWFISHPHDDHIGALTEILSHNQDIKIEKIYGSLAEEEWIEKHENKRLNDFRELQHALNGAGKKVIDLDQGQVLVLDRVRIEILSVKNPEITQNALNNSSVVIRVSDKSKSVLFLGDLGPSGGKKLLDSRYRNLLQADYVQMAHHGQRGVGKKFYEVVKPKYCLWPTPLWLWDNDNGGGINSGNWKTLKVRSWMKELGVQKHFVAGWGIQRID